MPFKNPADRARYMREYRRRQKKSIVNPEEQPKGEFPDAIKKEPVTFFNPGNPQVIPTPAGPVRLNLFLTTSDERVIQALRQHSDYGTKFIEVSMTKPDLSGNEG